MIINSDASGNPVTETVQSVAVTDASGNPVTGIDNLNLYRIDGTILYTILNDDF